MAHKLIGTIVEFTRPVIVKPGYRRLNEETNSPEEIEAKIEMQTVPGFIIGVEPQAEGFPRVHIAYMDPTKLHHVTGSGWRDAFERVDSVRPETHPDIEEHEHLAYYVSEEIYNDRYRSALTGIAVPTGNPELPSPVDSEPQPDVPPPPPETEPTPADATPAPATGRTRRKPGDPA